jgi:hypothetical protein
MSEPQIRESAFRQALHALRRPTWRYVADANGHPALTCSACGTEVRYATRDCQCPKEDA